MKHDWIVYGEDRQHPFRRLRRCKNCRAVQEWCDIQNWGRVVGYHWHPTVGRCRPLFWARATQGRQATKDGRYWVERDENGDWSSNCRDFQNSKQSPIFFDPRFVVSTRQQAKCQCEAYERTRTCEL